MPCRWGTPGQLGFNRCGLLCGLVANLGDSASFL